MEEQDEIKTSAQLEAEARERAKAEISGQKTTAAQAPPGQPKVVQHNKPKSKRTWIVAIFSLCLLVGIATGGDYLMRMTKGGKTGQESEAKDPSANSTASTRERTGMGRDANPFDIQQSGSGQETSGHTQQANEKQPAPSVNFSKASALSGTELSSASYQSRSAAMQATAPSAPADSTLAQCQKVLVRDSDGKLRCPDVADSATATTKNDGIARVTGVKRLNLDPNLYIPVDRHIPCSMLRRFVSDVAGTINCMISEDVYSANNFVRLIPAGTIARGIYKTGTLKHGTGRMFIAFTELRTPEPGALTIPLLDTQAVGQLGENGIAGWIDEHWGDRIGNTILLGSVQDFTAALADTSPSKNRNTDYTENTRAATSEMAKTVLENSIGIPPTMYLNQGDVIGLSTGADIDFSAVFTLKAR